MILFIDRWNSPVIATVSIFWALFWGNVSFATESSASSSTAIQAPVAELAEYMTQLQVYTHKLSLSVAAANIPLAQFYIHESIAHLRRIQEVFPEYEQKPIALLIDRLSIEAYEPLNALLNASEAGAKEGEFEQALEVILNACNACHVSCQTPIRIQRNDSNPYLQDFTP
jgi:hypothetical protein